MISGLTLVLVVANGQTSWRSAKATKIYLYHLKCEAHIDNVRTEHKFKAFSLDLNTKAIIAQTSGENYGKEKRKAKVREFNLQQKSIHF